MKIFRKVAWAALVLGVLAVIGAWAAESSYAGRARLIQIVEPSEAATLFGDAGNMVGTPQQMIVGDEKAVMPGKGPNGSVLVNSKYLREHGIYPLQLQTVRYVAHWVRILGFCALVGGLVGLGALRAKPLPPPEEQVEESTMSKAEPG